MNSLSQILAVVSGLIVVLLGVLVYLKKKEDDDADNAYWITFWMLVGGILLIAFGVGGTQFIHQILNS